MWKHTSKIKYHHHDDDDDDDDVEENHIELKSAAVSHSFIHSEDMQKDELN